jgi:hypothetical protein
MVPEAVRPMFDYLLQELQARLDAVAPRSEG